MNRHNVYTENKVMVEVEHIIHADVRCVSVA